MKQFSDFVKKHQGWGILLLIIVMCIIPWFVKASVTRLLTITLIYCISSCGLMLIFGMGGMFATGIVAFLGIGSYVTAIILCKTDIVQSVPILGETVVLMLLSGLGTMFVGFLVCLPILRLTADFVGMISTAFLNIFLAIVTSLDITGGSVGIYRIPKITFFGHAIMDKKAQFYIIFAMTIFIIWLVWNLLNSKIGRAMMGIRDNEIGTTMIGVQPRKMKLLTFCIGTFLAGVSGCLFAQYQGAIAHTNFTFTISTTFVQMCVIGGIGTLPGTILGTFIINIIPEIFRPLATYRLGIAGLLMVLLMVFRPQGILGSRAYAGDQGVIDRFRQMLAVRKSKKLNAESGK